ncbi:hypothetical protein [Sandaracinus amylolyticus]|uniref:Putative autotransporter protein n=1 Tax=Sandaracinus amylolyticus TaxID=927083 RepID=A0A0F6SEV8_9BACT|nr:hypothetical protein [Sandaracinus amylolyticus]AKF05869.1 putative autotransporter protein [Sandaracinus amylolyticus]
MRYLHSFSSIAFLLLAACGSETRSDVTDAGTNDAHVPGDAGGHTPDAGPGPRARCEPASLPDALDAARWDERFSIAGFTGHDGFAPAVHDFAIDADGDLLATGRFQYANGEHVTPLMRFADGAWTPARTTWEVPPTLSGFAAIAVDAESGALALATHDVFQERRTEIWVDTGTGLRVIAHVIGVVRTLAWANGTLWAAGPMTIDEGDVDNVAIWSGTTWSTAPGGATDGAAYELLVERVGDRDHVIVGGAFESIGGVSARRVAEWNGTSWRGYDLALGNVYALARDADGVLHAGGMLFGGEPGEPGGLLRWNGSAWEMVAGGLSNPTFTGVVSDIARVGDGLFVAGCFTHGLVAPEGAEVRARGLVRWQDGAWTALDDGTAGVGSSWFHSLSCGDEGPLSVFEMEYQRWAVHGDRVFLAGSFAGVGGVASQTIIARQADAWVAQGDAGAGLAGSIDALAVGGPECEVHGLGSITHASGAAVDASVVRWDGDAWTTLGPRLGQDVYCPAIEVMDDGAVIVGCAETMPEGPTPLGRLLRLDRGTWTPIDLGELGPVQDLARDSEGRLWIVGGAETGYVARWDGTTVQTIADDANALVYRVDVGPDASGREIVVVGGGFFEIGGIDATRIARWDGAAWSAFEPGLPSTPMAIEIAGDVVWASTAAEGGDYYALAHWNGTRWTDVATAANGVDPETFSVGSIVARDGLVIAAGSILVGGETARPRSVYVWDGERFEPLGGGVGAMQVASMALTDDALWLGGAIAVAGEDDEEISTVGVARRVWSE